MNALKNVRDYITKAILGSASVPRGLYDLSEYTRCHKGISFNFTREKGVIIAKSNNFQWGIIITEAKTPTELDKNIKDAILAAFEIPASYKKEASIERINEARKEYALA